MRREERLRKGREFDTAYREGVVIRGPFFVLRALPNESGHPRWGFAVGKRLLKRAVDRNRQKRRMREAARQSAAELPCDLVLTARQQSIDAPFGELVAEIQQLVRRAARQVEQKG
jgi:ribonuclease P protein component